MKDPCLPAANQKILIDQWNRLYIRTVYQLDKMRLWHSYITFSLLIGITLESNYAWAGQEVDYLTQVKPILATKCYACHGALKQKGKLRLETRGLMLKGKVIVPGKAAKSLLIEKI
ncbi:uncharacterized protein METZ01_LOCUS476828, partial [marine metagenome]